VSEVGDLVFLGDVHLDRGMPEVGEFVAMLEAIRPTTRKLVLAGDLFNLWIGRRELEQPHQTAVLEAFERLRSDGVSIRYVEGNRDYRIGAAYVGRYLDEASETGLVETHGGKRVFAIHGDLANPEDRAYRRWRRFSRSAPVWWMFHALPQRRRLRLAERLEARLRTTNLDYKREFPERAVRRYGESILADGHDLVVLGHFHVERDLRALDPKVPGRILVLPEWKASRRMLRVGPDGAAEFLDSPGA
jgi:UDP-2,3-diacylglucosamine hydrolase